MYYDFSELSFCLQSPAVSVFRLFITILFAKHTCFRKCTNASQYESADNVMKSTVTKEKEKLTCRKSRLLSHTCGIRKTPFIWALLFAMPSFKASQIACSHVADCGLHKKTHPNEAMLWRMVPASALKVYRGHYACQD